MKKLILILITIMMVSCGTEEDNSSMYNTTMKVSEYKQLTKENIKNDKNKCFVTGYDVVGSDFYRYVEKFVIDGHEYLVFSSRLANPPTVIHNEACPCKNKE